MRWNTPSERTQLILLSPMIVPVGLAALICFLPFAPLLWLLERYGAWDISRGWRRWFAWRPVYVDCFWDDEPSRWVWLETIERRAFHGGTLFRWPECAPSLSGNEGRG